MNKKPSFLTSTFSVITLIVVVGFTALCVWKQDVASLKSVAEAVLLAYGVKKGMEMSREKENQDDST